MKRIVQGLYQLESCAPVNVYLAENPSDLTLVDAGPEDKAEALLAELRDNGFDFKDVGRILMTHAHANHAGALKALLGKHRVRVYAHESEVPALLSGNAAPPISGLRGLLGLFRRPASWPPIDAAMALDQNAQLRGLPQWQVLHTPGHTPGSLSLFHPGRQILICGDVLGNERGNLRLPEGPAQDERALADSVRVLARLDCDILCCGHGPVIRGGAFRFIEALAKRL